MVLQLISNRRLRGQITNQMQHNLLLVTQELTEFNSHNCSIHVWCIYSKNNIRINESPNSLTPVNMKHYIWCLWGLKWERSTWFSLTLLRFMFVNSFLRKQQSWTDIAYDIIRAEKSTPKLQKAAGCTSGTHLLLTFLWNPFSWRFSLKSVSRTTDTRNSYGDRTK